eukprot:5204206-Pyramimonas_sp.AAC.1
MIELFWRGAASCHAPWSSAFTVMAERATARSVFKKYEEGLVEHRLLAVCRHRSRSWYSNAEFRVVLSAVLK